jgi:hypothetical protein
VDEVPQQHARRGVDVVDEMQCGSRAHAGKAFLMDNPQLQSPYSPTKENDMAIKADADGMT